MNDKYKRDGTPYTGTFNEQLMAWGKDMSDMNYKIVKQELLENGYWISTVWLGLNHSFDQGPPLIFETMIFCRNEKCGCYENDLGMDRYSTEEEALRGHQRMVDEWKNKPPHIPNKK